ncbi:MAG: Rrf2 family transcriptional regulator [Cyanobacteria bacterium SZAS LIN-3]|nr:Rrf2 family transcriptional regulator [Cyanobacteria bacterium SZAS LIN-3]MBS2006839.1 Rrf2 family transcriptional regulator [Cyanobacteria bacterium SZAS TMP-1]
MISQTAEYALRAMVFLAMRDSAATGHEIAETTKVPSGYLSKIMHQLVKGKLVNSQRGIGGGFVLSRKPIDISILDVINSVDPIDQIKSCPLGIQSHGFSLCPLHKRLSEATAHVEAAFAASNLSELVVESKNPLCASIPLTPNM